MRYNAYSRTADWSKKVYFESGNGHFRTPKAFSEVYNNETEKAAVHPVAMRMAFLWIWAWLQRHNNAHKETLIPASSHMLSLVFHILNYTKICEAVGAYDSVDLISTSGILKDARSVLYGHEIISLRA
jgi:hypothetical protein